MLEFWIVRKYWEWLCSAFFEGFFSPPLHLSSVKMPSCSSQTCLATKQTVLRSSDTHMIKLAIFFKTFQFPGIYCIARCVFAFSKLSHSHNLSLSWGYQGIFRSSLLFLFLPFISVFVNNTLLLHHIYCLGFSLNYFYLLFNILSLLFGLTIT